MATNETCPGRYCGFTVEENSTIYSVCSACPKGYRTNNEKICEKCLSSPLFYDWVFLGFMSLLPFMLHWLQILRHKSKSTGKTIAVEFILSTLESVLAVVLTLLCIEPYGSFEVYSCGATRLSDWYTMFYNPQINYITTIHCTQEAVYPLSSMIFIYYGFSLALLILFRPFILSQCFNNTQWKDPLYSALYFHPILIVLHALAGGLLYYAFPYLTILISLSAIVTYFAANNVIQWRKLTSVAEGKNHFLAILWHMAILSYGIIAVTTQFYYLFLVLLPVLFFFVTVPLTNPGNIANEMTM